MELQNKNWKKCVISNNLVIIFDEAPTSIIIWDMDTISHLPNTCSCFSLLNFYVWQDAKGIFVHISPYKYILSRMTISGYATTSTEETQKIVTLSLFKD